LFADNLICCVDKKDFFNFRCVSGASSGIGSEICVQLANCGAIVIGLARRVEKIDELNGRLIL
jgi:NADP-dependent 3-hydroxy acid dehydrogenase YdfG